MNERLEEIADYIWGYIDGYDQEGYVVTKNNKIIISIASNEFDSMFYRKFYCDILRKNGIKIESVKTQGGNNQYKIRIVGVKNE